MRRSISLALCVHMLGAIKQLMGIANLFAMAFFLVIPVTQ